MRARHAAACARSAQRLPLRALKKKVLPCYSEMLLLMTCFKARARPSAAHAAAQPSARAAPRCAAHALAPGARSCCLLCSQPAQRGNFEDAKCMGEMKTLNTCVALQAKTAKEANTVNFHLQRLGRAAARGV